MPWLTPDSIPEGDDCRPLSIPADTAWLSLVSGALTELTKPYNWQKFGTLTVQETVDKMQSIIDSYYSSPCAMCSTPGGYRVTRIGTDGHLEQLDETGNWVDATDEYYIPPPDARTEGTPEDQNCLAAKNGANAIQALYESLSESYAEEFTADEALVAFIAAAVAAIGFEFAPITWSIAALGFVIFEALFKALEFVTADLWTADFTNQFACLLLNCAVNTAGVVTIDWDCFNNALLAQVDDFGLSELQMRLYVQIGYILFFIGGADGLNLAMRTTAITDDNCDFCAEAWCYRFDDANRLSEWNSDEWSPGTPIATYSSGAWHSACFTSGHTVDYVHLRWELGTTILLTDAGIIDLVGSCTGGGQGIWVNGDGSIFSGTQVWNAGGGYTGGSLAVTSIDILVFCVDAGCGDITFDGLQFSGHDITNPFGENNC